MCNTYGIFESNSAIKPCLLCGSCMEPCYSFTSTQESVSVYKCTNCESRSSVSVVFYPNRQGFQQEDKDSDIYDSGWSE